VGDKEMIGAQQPVADLDAGAGAAATNVSRLRLVDESAGALLPVLATSADAREVVRLLKRRHDGVTIIESTEAIRKRLFDPRKVYAYEMWGLVVRDGERLRLGRLGRELADNMGAEVEVYRAILGRVEPYRLALKWVQDEGFELVTDTDVGEFWRDEYPAAVGGEEGRQLDSFAACFIQLCHAANLGIATARRRGQPARLLIDRDELAAQVGRSGREQDVGSVLPLPPKAAAATRQGAGPSCEPAEGAAATPPERPRVYISTRRAEDYLASISEVFELTGFDVECVERGGGAADRFSDRPLLVMRRCSAGLICLGPEDALAGPGGLPSLEVRTAVEIGAALLQFRHRLTLLLDGWQPPPAWLGDIQSLEIGGGPAWDKAVRLAKTVRGWLQD
jgi:hypothetical protein